MRLYGARLKLFLRFMLVNERLLCGRGGGTASLIVRHKKTDREQALSVLCSGIMENYRLLRST